MSQNPKLSESLEHVAIIGRFRWNPKAPEDARRIVLPAKTSAEAAKKSIGFELAFGPSTQTIDDKHYRAFAVAPPADVERTWRESDRAQVRSIPLTDQKPLLDALGDEVTDARTIGGRLFRKLLDDLDALRPFWSPDFEYHLLIAALHFVCRERGSGGAKSSSFVLKNVLFQPNVSIRVLAMLRDTDALIEQNRQALLSALRIELQKEKLTESNAKVVADDAFAALLELRRAFAVEDSPLPPFLADKAIRSGVVDERLPADLGAQWRKFRVHFDDVRRLVECEPLVALMIVWYFGKISGDGNVVLSLYDEIYSSHKDKVVLGRTIRDADQATSERRLDTQLDGTLSKLQLDGQDKISKLMAAFARSVIVYVKGALYRERNPQSEFTRDALIDWLRNSFADLLPYGTDEGEAVMKELEAIAKEGMHVYLRFGPLYADQLTKEVLERAANDAPAAIREIWLASCKAAASREGTELGDEFRKEFNTRLADHLASHLELWLQKQIGDGQKGTALTERLEKIADHYTQRLKFLSAQGRKLAAATLAGSMVLRRDKQRVAEPPQPTGDKASAPKTLQQTAGATSNSGSTDRGSISDGNTAGNATQTEPVESEKDVNADEAGEEWSSFTKALLEGWDVADPFKATLEFGEQSLDKVRGRIVQRLQVEGGDIELAAARGSWRGIGLGENLLATEADESSLGKVDSSLGLFLLLEMVTHVGAVPRANRDVLEKPDQDLLCGVTAVPIWDIYKVPLAEEEAKRDIAGYVTYWEGLAQAVMNCHEYAGEVRRVQAVLQTALDKGVRVTFYNELATEHVDRQRVASLCFAAMVPSDGAGVPPPSHVWLTGEAYREPNLSDSLARFTSRFEREVAGFLAKPAAGQREVYSYPLLLARRLVAGFHSINWQPKLPEWWESDLALLTMIGVGF